MTLHTQSLAALDEVRAFLDGSAAVQFCAPGAAGRCRLAGSPAAAVPARDAQAGQQGGLLQAFGRKGQRLLARAADAIDRPMA